VFVTHYKRKYREPYMPPVWAVTEKMTMGELSKWFAATASNDVRTQIARDMGIPSKELLGSIIATLSYVRNLCAHHSRLWNRRLVKRLPKIKKYGADLVMNAQDGSQTDNLIYNVMVVCLHMLRVQSPQTTYGARLTDLVETVTDSQRAAMGFPADWRARPIWQPIPKAANP
jgi:abortive infection bacteriophage resistance protein